MQKIRPEKEPQPIVAYPFPLLAEGSVYFAFSGARVEKATISSKFGVLSVIKPDYPDDEIPQGVIDLDFFGGQPFHAKLAENWDVKITLQVRGREIPSLTFKPADKDITWGTINSAIYTEIVTVGSESGFKKLMLVYTPTIGGYRNID